MAGVVGLDLSLTSTGWASLYPGPAEVGTITSKGKAGASLVDRMARLRRLSTQVLDRVLDEQPELVVIESPAFSRTTGQQHDRSGLWWLVVSTLAEHGVTVVEVRPNVRAKYLSGRGNAGKDEVLACTIRRYPDVPIQNNDQADALGLACIGARLLGWPVEDSLPQSHLAAMKSVRLPNTEAA